MIQFSIYISFSLQHEIFPAGLVHIVQFMGLTPSLLLSEISPFLK